MNIKGKYNSAVVYTDNVEHTCLDQLKNLLDCSAFADVSVRVMPDCHAGAGCVVGYTQTLADKVVPNLVGVDINCGMAYAEVPAVDPRTLDKVIHAHVPAGMDIHRPGTLDKKTVKRTEDLLNALTPGLRKTLTSKNIARALNSVGTLGSGNHFIECAKSTKTGKCWLIVHTGSRNLGLQTANYWQRQAERDLGGLKRRTGELIAALKAEGRDAEIEAEIKRLKAESPKVPKELAYLEGDGMTGYLADVKTVSAYADLNRQVIVETILGKLGVLTPRTVVHTTRHNYIDLDRRIIRKGAVRAEADEQLLIPMNMRDGSLLCIGKGNVEWNYSAPHGAGRVMSRGQAKRELSMDDYRATMANVYTTSVNEATLDEAPMAYKDAAEIEALVSDTVEVVDHLVPVYNFKAGEE